ncbi:protein furry homolog isoform X3 [Bolinopsis microptera]|uniref:protein furry homolog isoform X3 n=1 Tax=Bolinopsis microptera TaxID=2820187 RepID=UPI003079E4A3
MGGSSQEIENNSDDDSGSSHMSVEIGSSHPSEINDQVNIHGSRGSTPTEFIARKHGVEPEVLAERVRTVLKFMNSRDQRPLWNYEQITPQNLNIDSVHLMHSFLNSVLSVFDALVDIELKKEFCKETLSWAVHCGQRHYAGRSFEIFRCLQTELSSEFLLEVLRRLMDHVCDMDDSQTGYVVECLLTLECNILLLSERIHSELLPQFKSKTDTIKRRPIDTRRHSSWDVLPPGTKVTSKQHLLGGSTASDEVRGRSSSEHNNLRVKAYSLTSFRDSFSQLAIECLPQEFSLKELLTDDDLFVISRVFWCSLCLSESDLEHEFSFATRLMKCMLDCLCVSDTYTENLLEKVLEEMSWNNFPGVIHLFLKGVPTLDLSEPTLELLAKLIPLSRKKAFRGIDDTALPLTILSLLPKLIASYDSPDAFCCKVAEDISMICRDYEPLKDLAKVMQMYIEHTYPRNCQMWIGAVCKYINDAYIEHCPDFLVYLINVLQNGPHDYHEAILKIVYQSIKHIFLNHHFIPIHNPRVLQVLAKHEFSTTHEDQQILKLIISHSSTISLPVDTANIDHYRASLGAFSLFEHGLPELPGRSIQFKVDFKSDSSQEGTMSSSTSQQSLANSTHNLVPSTNWRRPTVCFRKCRDRIASLLKISGDIEQTNSLVFSAASDCEISKDMYQSTSSSDSVSGMEPSIPHANVNQSSSIPSIPDDTSLAGALNQFDFLNDENTADEGNDTDSINSSWRGGLNASSYQAHSRDSSVDSLGGGREKTRFKSMPHMERDELDTPMRRAVSTMSPSRHVYPGKSQYDDDNMTTDSELSDDGQNNTLKRPRSSASPHSRLYSKQKNKIEEHEDDSSDTSSPDGPDSATPKLEYFDSSSSDLDEEGGEGPMSPQAPDLFVLPPSPNYCNSVELKWLDSVTDLIRNTSKDLDCHIILIFQRIVKCHLLFLRETLTSSLDGFSHALPEEILSVFNQCLSTFNILEVPFIFIDNVLLKQEYVKNKIQYHILESRDKIEYLAKHQLITAQDIRSLAGHSSGGPKNMSKQNLKAKRRITQVCMDLQALHFQYCSLYRTFSNVVDLVCELRKEESALDLSDYVSDLASRLFQAQMNPDIASLSSHSDKSLPRDIFTLDPLPEQGVDSEQAPSPGTSPRSNGSIPEIKHTKLSRSRDPSNERSREPSNESSRTRGSESSRTRESSIGAPSAVTLVVETVQTPEVPVASVLPVDVPVINIGSATVNRPNHKDKKRMSHRRGYSEANIEMFKSVQLEFTEGINKSSVSQYNLNINPTATSPTSPPNMGLTYSDSVNNIHLSQVELRVENIGQDGVSEDDTSSVVSEIPPPLTPGTEPISEQDFPLPPPPNEAYYTSPQIARREIERGIQHAPSTESIPEEELDESLYTEMGELKLLSQLELEERRSRKGSSNEGSRHSRTSSTSGPHSTSFSSEDSCEVKIPIPGAEQEMVDCTLTSTALQLSPSNQTITGMSPTIYTGIMSSLTDSQCIVFINDHINAVADTAAIETLHQARSRFGGFYFGTNECEDTLTLVGIFCQHGTIPGTNGTAGKVALWGTTCEDLVKTTLMTDTLHLENAMKSFT